LKYTLAEEFRSSSGFQCWLWNFGKGLVDSNEFQGYLIASEELEKDKRSNKKNTGAALANALATLKRSEFFKKHSFMAPITVGLIVGVAAAVAVGALLAALVFVVPPVATAVGVSLPSLSISPTALIAIVAGATFLLAGIITIIIKCRAAYDFNLGMPYDKLQYLRNLRPEWTDPEKNEKPNENNS
jgi:hypothetical protein